MLMDKVLWVNCDSCGDMKARLSGVEGKVFEILIADEPNTWGYLAIYDEDNIFIPIGFADNGLSPQVKIHDKTAFVGVSDNLSGYSLATGRLFFSYKMPTVFHEFVTFNKDIFIVQDEIGFVGLFYTGEEKWIKICDDIIETYQLNDNSIFGKTIEGDKFNFTLTPIISDPNYS